MILDSANFQAQTTNGQREGREPDGRIHVQGEVVEPPSRKEGTEE